MRTIPQVLVALLSLTLGRIAGTGLVHAQEGKQGSVGEKLEGMRNQLGLSQEQFSEIKSLLEDEAEKLKTLKNDTSHAEAEKRAKAREVSSEIREKIGALLTPEQKEKASDLRRSRAGSPAGDGQRNEAAQRLMAMKEKLALTDEQMEKLKPIFAEEAPKMKALREDKNSTEQDKRKVLKESMEKIAAELSPEQREKMRDQIKNRQK